MGVAVSEVVDGENVCEDRALVMKGKKGKIYSGFNRSFSSSVKQHGYVDDKPSASTSFLRTWFFFSAFFQSSWFFFGYLR